MIMMVLAAIIGLIYLVIWIWGLIDIIQASNSDFSVIEGENAKLIWFLIVFFVPLGVIIYAILEKTLFMQPGFKPQEIIEEIKESAESA